MGRRTVRIYQPDSRFGESALSAMRHLAAEIRRHRAHVLLIFRRDFEGAYRGTRLGVFWNFALPLLPISVYIFLSLIGVFPSVEGLPRSLFVCFSMTLWLLFSGLIEQPISIVQSRNAESMKTSLPIAVSIASSFAALAFETLLRVGLVAVIMLATFTPPKPYLPLALLVIAVGCVFSLSIGLLLAIANIALPDTRSIVNVVMRYGIFLSSVVFPLSAIGPLHWFELLNPLAVFIHAARDLAFEGLPTHPVALAVFGAISVGLAIFSARVFYIMEYRIRGVM